MLAMGLIGLLGALTVVAVVGMWMTMKAVMTQVQASQAGVETEAPGLLYRRSYSMFKIVVAVILAVEVWPGLATWAYDAWQYIPL